MSMAKQCHQAIIVGDKIENDAYLSIGCRKMQEVHANSLQVL